MLFAATTKRAGIPSLLRIRQSEATRSLTTRRLWYVKNSYVGMPVMRARLNVVCNEDEERRISVSFENPTVKQQGASRRADFVLEEESERDASGVCSAECCLL